MHNIKILTFGFKFGHPQANYYFDVSFLKNPVREQGAKLSDKFNHDMLTFVRSQSSSGRIVDVMFNLIELLREEHADVVIGIGCNSGKHRSRAVAEILRGRLEKSNINCIVEHRDD